MAYNPREWIDPTGSMVSSIGQRATDVVGNFFQNSAVWNKRKSQLQNDTALKADFFTGAVKVLQEHGIQPKQVPIPDYRDENITPEDYAKKTGAVVAQVFTLENLKKQGVDTAELEKTMKYPELFNQEATRLLSSHVGKKISGDYGPEVYQAIMSGKMYPEEINKKYGTNLDQETYERIAGLSVPQPLGGFSAKAQAAQDKPMTQQQAMADTGIAQPMPYSKALQTVTGSNLPKTETDVLQPLITSAANRSTAQTYGALQDPSETQFLTSKLGKGEPVDEGAKAVAGAMRAESALEWQKQKQAELLEYKKKYTQMRQQEQDNSRLKILLQDSWKRGDFKLKYGEAAEKAAKGFFDVEKQLTDVDQQIETALNWDTLPYDYTKNKAQPDIAALFERRRVLDNERTRLRSAIPDLKSLEQQTASPTPITPPVELPTEVNTAPPSLDFGSASYKKAKTILTGELKKKGINRQPTPREIQRLMNHPNFQGK